MLTSADITTRVMVPWVDTGSAREACRSLLAVGLAVAYVVYTLSEAPMLVPLALVQPFAFTTPLALKLCVVGVPTVPPSASVAAAPESEADCRFANEETEPVVTVLLVG